ncbi:MAG: sigma factor [Pirellulales bacterium]
MHSSFADSAETHRLLMRIRAGDRDAFNDLFERYRERLHDVVALRLDPKLGPRLDASDVVQDAQLEAFRRLDDYLERQLMPFGIWIRKTAQERLCKNYVERTLKRSDAASIASSRCRLDRQC